MTRAEVINGLSRMIGNTEMNLKYSIMNGTKRRLELEREIMTCAIKLLVKEAGSNGRKEAFPYAVGDATTLQDGAEFGERDED